MEPKSARSGPLAIVDQAADRPPKTLHYVCSWIVLIHIGSYYGQQALFQSIQHCGELELANLSLDYNCMRIDFMETNENCLDFVSNEVYHVHHNRGRDLQTIQR